MKISIITAAYDAQDTIKDAFHSVLSQTYRHIRQIEHIIVDGASNSRPSSMRRVFCEKHARCGHNLRAFLPASKISEAK